MVEATLCDEVTDEHLVMWDRDWIPEMRAFVASGAHSTPEDAHWDLALIHIEDPQLSFL
jgi:hypothetical protein